MKKLLCILLTLAALTAIAVAVGYAVFAFITKDAKLDESRLTDYSRTITVCDCNGEEIADASLEAKRSSVSTEQLRPYTVNAFIASEDRNFYSHRGLNYKRMIKALFTNIATHSFSQGASTISQQLIKNTHLTGDKTIKRKLTEIKLTKKLERMYSKDEILEMYLNTIYFGHNCYGLDSAARFYFGVPAEDLTLSQSAALAGLIASPNNYSPYNDAEKCAKRRNTVLKAMLECSFIDEKEYESALREEIVTAPQTGADDLADYISAVFSELEKLGLDYYGLLDGGKVITYLDRDLQNVVDGIEEGCDCAAIVTSQDGGVKAYRSDIAGAKRQPGSTIKPLLVYAPAIEEKLICPATRIADERVDFGGYSPSNHDGRYHGYISAAEALAKSYNIPAVKTLNALTLAKAEKYAQRLGITLEEDDKNLALALGGMSHGLTLAQLCEKYRAFAGGGAYSTTKFIREVTLKGGNAIYRAPQSRVAVFSQGTASLMNGILKTAVTDGTAKRLKRNDCDIAAKTGTCGNAEGNTDSYCIAYTSADCAAVWLGSADNERLNVTSGRCCEAVNSIFEELYRHNTPCALDTESGTTEVKIDGEEYSKNNKIVLADAVAPELSTLKIRTLRGSEPKERSTYFSNPTIKKPQISAQNNTVFIELYHTKYYAYIIKRKIDSKATVVYEGPWKERIEDNFHGGEAVYSVTPYYFDGRQKYFGKEIDLPPVCLSGGKSPQDSHGITGSDWIND